MLRLYLLLLTCVLILTATNGLAATVRVVEAGATQLVIKGEGLSNVAAGEITLQWQSPPSGTVAVSQGGLVKGAMFVANTNLPGQVRIAFASTSPFEGTGTIGVVTTNSSGGVLPVVSVLRVSLRDPAGKALAVQSIVQIPKSVDTVPLPASEPSQSGEPIMKDVSHRGNRFTVGSGPAPMDNQPEVQAIIERSDTEKELPGDEVEVEADLATPVEAREPKEDADLGKAPPEVVFASVPSILSRFLDYEGKRNPPALQALYSDARAEWVRQIPWIVMSDGVTPVRVVVSGIKAVGKVDLLVAGAKLLGSEFSEDGALAIEVVPDRGTWEASLHVLLPGQLVEYPLTVVPFWQVDLDRSGDISEQDFERYLDTKTNEPRQELADYIFTGNYLLGRKGKEFPRQ